MKKIIEYIRTMDHPNAEQLARRFHQDEGIDISTVTIYRYIQYLKNTEKAPIKADMNRHGSGYYLEDPDFWTDKIILSPGELVGLGLLQSLMKSHKNTPVERDISSLFEKMSRYMPDGERYDGSKIARYIHVITGPTAKIEEGIFNTLITCVQNHMTFSFNYSKSGSDKPQKYTIDPYRIILAQNGDWYVMGCKTGERTEMRTFAFARISDIEPTGGKFAIPVDFKLEKYIDPEMGVWKTSSFYSVKLLFDRLLAQHARERKWHRTEKITENGDGTILVEFKTSQLMDLMRIVLSYGSHVQVLEPIELIDEIKKELADMSSFYKK